MNKLPAIKVYDIDYSFIIKNYLNPEMWQKSWVIFQYKTFVITLRLSSINCKSEKVCFEVEIKDNSTENKYAYEWGENTDKHATFLADYSLKVDNIDFLKREIRSRIFLAIERMEGYYIMATDEYKELSFKYENEVRLLTKIAEDFLDQNNVKNEEIRNVYIDNFVSNNTTLDTLQSKLKDKEQYTKFPDFYLIFANATKDDSIIKKWEYTIADANNLEEIKKEINEYLAYMETEKFQEEKSDELEEI